MKQGSGTSSHSGGKVEPRSMAIRPAGVAQIGIAQGTHVMDKGEMHGAFERMHAGRGFKAPMDMSVTHHKGGSQRST